MLPRCWKLRKAYEAYSASAIICVCPLLCAAARACQLSPLSGTGSLAVGLPLARLPVPCHVLAEGCPSRQVLAAANHVLTANLHAETAGAAQLQPHRCGIRSSTISVEELASDTCTPVLLQACKDKMNAEGGCMYIGVGRCCLPRR